MVFLISRADLSRSRLPRRCATRIRCPRFCEISSAIRLLGSVVPAVDVVDTDCLLPRIKSPEIKYVKLSHITNDVGQMGVGRVC